MVVPKNLYALRNELVEENTCKSANLFGQYIHYTSNIEVNAEGLKTNLINKGHSNIEVFQIQPNIEDCFIKLMGDN